MCAGHRDLGSPAPATGRLSIKQSVLFDRVGPRRVCNEQCGSTRTLNTLTTQPSFCSMRRATLRFTPSSSTYSTRSPSRDTGSGGGTGGGHADIVSIGVFGVTAPTNDKQVPGDVRYRAGGHNKQCRCLASTTQKGFSAGAGAVA